MTNQKHFCTCTETTCQLNPCNHDLGCDPCIRKNLNKGEIPGCFFHLIDDDTSQLHDFTIEGFVKFYMDTKKP
ncbi:DUF6485 family protein [Lacrimispora sp.]|uniref:DUF6485 family protein n=1 Tax=Lacrimispora sp. TaxID=2719234 RepID=UPI003993F04C